MNVQALRSDRHDPKNPCLSPALPTNRCSGATEIYGLFRSTLSLNQVLRTSAFSKGPSADVSLLIGADANTENRYSDAAKRSIVAGLQFSFVLPYGGFVNAAPLYYKEANHSAYVECGKAFNPAAPCLAKGNLSYKGTWAVETGYNMKLGFLPHDLRFFTVSGRVNVYGPKGDENSPLASPRTKVEIDSEPIRLTFDAGKAFWHATRDGSVNLWIAYRYWGNKYGFDPGASSVCQGVGAGSCSEKTIYTGISAGF